MIKISELKEPAFDDIPIITYNVGEITKITDDSYYECSLLFHDSKGASFFTHTKWNAVRYYSLCGIGVIPERDDLVPKQFKNNPKIDYMACSDPRVIWACIVSLWITNVMPRNKKDTKEGRNKILTSLLPSYQEASVWLLKNGFKLNASKEDERATSDKYLADYGALKYPPKVDWSIFPDQKDD